MTMEEMFSCDRDIVEATVAMVTLLDLGSLWQRSARAGLGSSSCLWNFSFGANARGNRATLKWKRASELPQS
jgi:hypothetical protein